MHQEAISIKSELEQKENDGDLQDNTKSMHLEQHSIDEAQNINNNEKKEKKDDFTTDDASVS